MATLSLREAAQQAGASKSTILRAIQSGRLSAARLDNGGYAIDTAELFRVYPPKAAATVAHHSTHRSVGHGAPPVFDGNDLTQQLRTIELEAEIKSLRAILENEQKRADELRVERDRWAAQAERLALPSSAQNVGLWGRLLNRSAG